LPGGWRYESSVAAYEHQRVGRQRIAFLISGRTGRTYVLGSCRSGLSLSGTSNILPLRGLPARGDCRRRAELMGFGTQTDAAWRERVGFWGVGFWGVDFWSVDFWSVDFSSVGLWSVTGRGSEICGEAGREVRRHLPGVGQKSGGQRVPGGAGQFGWRRGWFPGARSLAELRPEN
jgi:hypothetical protein